MSVKPLAIIVTVLVLAGCSSLRVAYFGADVVVRNQVAFYLADGDEIEDAFVDEKLDQAIGWHRANMLPLYAKFLERQAIRLENNDTGPATIRAAMGEARTLYEETVRGVLPDAAVVLARHTTEPRIAHLRDRFEEKNQERAEDLAEPRDERLEQRTERLISHFERFLGDLQPPQQTILATYAAETLDGSIARLESRKRRQKVFLGFLATQPEQESISGYVEKLVLDPDETMDPTYGKQTDERRQRFETLLVEMIGSLTAEQRAAAAALLRSYAQDLLAISS